MTDWPYQPSNAVYIGHDHWYAWIGWSPDRDLNPQYEGIPDEEHFGVNVGHFNPNTGEPCQSFATVKGEVTARLAEHPMWEMSSLEPLTIAPSLLCRICGDHGFIREGKWVPV